MTDQEKEWHEERLLVERTIARICGLASGSAKEECVRNCPKDVYFIGSLRPEDFREDDGASSESDDEDTGEETAEDIDAEDDRHRSRLIQELRMKLSPVAFGAEFLLCPQPEGAVVSVKVHWVCYYRVFPTLQQQRDYLKWTQNRPSGEVDAAAAEDSAEGGTGSASEEGQTDRRRRVERLRSEAMCPRFRKIECHASGEVRIKQGSDATWSTDLSQLKAALEQETARARQVAAQDTERFRCFSFEDVDVDVPLNTLESDVKYQRFLETLRVDVLPTWRWRVVPDTRPTNDPRHLIFSLQFVNASPIDPAARHLEGFFFETNAAFSFSKTEVKPFELAVVPRGFRYDRRILSKGFNCHVEQTCDLPPTLLTTHTPIHTQMRYVTRTDPPARFAELADDPVPVLEVVKNSMEAYRSIWAEARQRYVDIDPEWEASSGEEFDHDFAIYTDEIDRFSKGVELLRSDPDIRLAFELTNRTFLRGSKDSWRLFQIVFLVSEIPGIAALAPEHSGYASERRMVDILYFPTGGGKTEAYLGLIVFHCFYDRLRGKRKGVTAWTRFPLRLLTLQQTQRAADVIGIAELVRREHTDRRLSGANVDGFAVGYFVGKGGSPNEIVPPRAQGEGGGADALTWSITNDLQQRQQWKRVVRCPACGTDTVEVDFDSTAIRLLHRCRNEACDFPDGILPVYVVDNEIFRYLPSLVVGTVDKLAGLGNQRKVSMLFGAVDGFCPEHGYFKRECCQKGCEGSGQWVRSVPDGISGVTLFVQDELHLLKEGLGTFDAHYETFAQRVRREFGHDDELKIVASSATVEAFDRQVEHLYGRNRRDARRFPGLGPTLRESFYAETLDLPQRVFVGVLPHNKTILRAMLELIQYYHETMLAFERTSEGDGSPYSGSLVPGSKEYAGLMDLYRTSLTYSGKRDVSEMHTDIEGDVNRVLAACNLPPLNIMELTGDTPTDEVAVVLRHLEGASTPGAPADSVLATSMVSHGVDIDRLNSMIFYGMPRLNAEYIQASSRVGRSHVGIVFTCFHPVRERDQSHYEYFVKNHEFLGQLVEPVAINRWSRFSVNHTLPGLFMAVLLQVIANREQRTKPNRYYLREHVASLITSGQLQPDEFIQMLSEAYGVVGVSSPGPLTFLQEIQRRIPIFLYDQITASGAGLWVSDALNPSPMRSLRDVDDPVLFELNFLGSEWARRSAVIRG